MDYETLPAIEVRAGQRARLRIEDFGRRGEGEW